jgi:hypothetical protein
VDDYTGNAGSENAAGGGKRATRRRKVASGANEGPSAPRGGPLHEGPSANGRPRGRGRGALDDGVLVDHDDDHGDDRYEEDEDLFGEEDPGGGEDDCADDHDDGDADDYYEEEAEYDSWREWFADDYKRVVVGLVGVLFVFLGVLYFGWSFVSGGGDEEAAPPAPAPREEERPGAGEAGGPSATDAGELEVVVPDGGKEGPVEVTLSESEARPRASSWSGEITRQKSEEGGEDGYAAVSLSGGEGNSSWASCTSVVSEGGARSWLCHLKDTSMDGLILTASQNSDPGPAALEGRMPFLGGRYLVKSTDGSFSASGDYEDILLDESTMERTYEETYLDDSGEPKRRTMKAEYKVAGDAGLLPAPIGYEPPPGTAPAGGSS